MANKRMINTAICASDAFLDMPTSTQALYLQLNLKADDDGLVGNPKSITRMVGAAEDDLKLLIAKGFVLAFDTGVIVIKHWRMHNTLSNNTYHETQYLEEKAALLVKENGAYSFTSGVPIDDSKIKALEERRRQSRRKKMLIENSVNNGEITETLTVNNGEITDLDKIRLDKTSIDKIREDKTSIDKDSSVTVSSNTACRTDVQRVAEAWNDLSLYGVKGISKLTPNTKRYDSLISRLKQYSVEDVLTAIDNIKHSDFLQGKSKGGWLITFDWFVKPNNFIKVFEGNYDNRDYQTPATTRGNDYDAMDNW